MFDTNEEEDEDISHEVDKNLEDRKAMKEEAIEEEEKIEKDVEGDQTLQPVLQERIKSPRINGKNPKLVLAGNVYHIVKEKKKMGVPKTPNRRSRVARTKPLEVEDEFEETDTSTYRMYRTSRHSFDHVKLCAQMFFDHLPNAYANSLKIVQHNLDPEFLTPSNLAESTSPSPKPQAPIADVTLFALIKYGSVFVVLCGVISWVVAKERSLGGRGAWGGGFWTQFWVRVSGVVVDVAKEMGQHLLWGFRAIGFGTQPKLLTNY